MSTWQNWSGRHTADATRLVFVRSEADAAALVAHCAARGETLRVAGAGHSHSPIVATDGAIVDPSGLAGVLDIDSQNKQAWISAGSSIFSLGAQLDRAGLALKNQGDIDRQLLGGAIATGTHGTGRNLQNLSASVVGLQLILASGEPVACRADLEPELFQAARLGIGSVGFVTRILMQLTESVVLQEQMLVEPFDATVKQIDALAETHERFEFFWYPATDEANIKLINPVRSEPVYPLAPEGSRQARSYEVLPNHRPHLHTEMEYSVPAEDGAACLMDIRALIQTSFPQVRWPVEYRTVAQDDIWLSMANGRPTVTISVHEDIRQDEVPYYRACEEIFLSYGGRPHWGKVNYLSREQFAQCYPHWEDWWRIRDHVDPRGLFLNDYVRGIRPV